MPANFGQKHEMKIFWLKCFEAINSNRPIFKMVDKETKKKQKGISQYPKKPLNFHWARPTQSANQSVCCQSGVFDDVRDQYAWRISLVI